MDVADSAEVAGVAAVAGVVEAAAVLEVAGDSADLVAAVRAVEERAAVGSGEDAMIPMEIVDEFVKRVRDAGGANIESVILFGSAVAGHFHEGLSNLNLLCVLKDTSFQSLEALGRAARWWDKQKQPPPLCLSRRGIERSTDVFTIELLDMQQHHRVLFGPDVLADLQVPMDLHRVQVEYELREKLLLLREHILVSSQNDGRLWELLLRSGPSFATLFRHALIALGDRSDKARREAVQAISERLGLPSSALLEVLDVREKQFQKKRLNVRELAARYLAEVEKVTSAVDLAFDKNPSPRT